MLEFYLPICLFFIHSYTDSFIHSFIHSTSSFPGMFMLVYLCVFGIVHSHACAHGERGNSLIFCISLLCFFLHVGLSVYQQLETSAIPDRQQSGSYYLHPRTFNSLVRARVREMYCKTEFLNRCLQGCSGSELKSLNFKCKHLTQ